MTHHCLMTRSAYAADYPLEANRRRLELLRTVTAPALAAQTVQDWTWLVRIDATDPLLEERRAAVLAAVPGARFLLRARPWSEVLPAGVTLQTRLDDDDALAPDFVERIQRAAAGTRGRIAWMLRVGWKFDGRCADRWVREANQFVTLQVPDGDPVTVYDVEHPHIGELAPIRRVDDDPAWVWLRHRDVRGKHRTASGDPSPVVGLVPAVDWQRVAGMIA